MKTRIVPCIECRIRRRKCIRINNSNSKCTRCDSLGLSCLQTIPKKKNSNSDRENKQMDVDVLNNQVAELEWTIQQLETQMKTVQYKDSPSPQPQQQALVSLNNSANYLTEELVVHLIPQQWQFKIKNGQFQIETGIRNLSDLLLCFGKKMNNLSYLSPLSSYYSSSSDEDDLSSYSTPESYLGGSSGLLIQFGSNTDDTFIPFTAKLLSRCAKIESKRTVINHSQAESLYSDYTVVIDRLIHTYFSCHNPLVPLFHERHFMAKYQNIIDPMNDLLCVSIACLMCCSNSCEHFHFFSAKDKRQLADFFFSKAKSILLDQFDDPEKKLENVMAINLLARYLHMTLKIKECRELVSLAYQICIDLSREYELDNLNFTQENIPLDPPTPPVSPYDVRIRPFTDYDVNCVLYSRHITLTLSVQKFMEFLTNSTSDLTRYNLPYWQIMEDESEDMRRYIHSQNWVFKLINHPFIVHFTSETQKVQQGATCTLSFESIVRIEDAVAEWNLSIPKEYRLCDRYLDTKCCKTAIDNSNDCILILAFMHYQVVSTIIYSTLLRPMALKQNADDLPLFIQKHSLEKTLEGCRLLIYATQRISQIDATTTGEGHYYFLAVDFLQHATDVLILLAFSPNLYVQKEARIMLRNCLGKIDDVQLTSHDNHVPPSLSPLFNGTMDLNDASTFDLDFYDQYPDPWSALMYDTSHYISTL